MIAGTGERRRSARRGWSGGQAARAPKVAVIALAAAALLLSGCVYLRLFELKQQLARFDRFFSLQTQDGLALICLTPVVRSNDIRWIGVKPEHTKKIGQAEQWQVRMVKQKSSEAPEKVPFDILLEFTFVEDKLTRVAIPERYFALMPKSFLVGVIRSLGGGKVDQLGKQIEATVAGADIAAARPRLPAIDRLLGAPTEEREDGTRSIVRYRYSPATAEPRPGVFDMILTFDTKSGDLLKWQGVTPVGKIGFDFSADRAKR
ncbi:hypothetical protein [Horticoccus sp. 23ND18S-11]|uniref:hypothetical protein n=1 Tax=Horticoccus sp. 23ND18S-11 TaxID=3391832 RepID=UPI0039C9EB69